jgi:serine protease
MLGLTGPTNGDSSIAQTFSAPSGSSTLSFWYRNVCPDTLTYDWATATLTDNTTGTTQTVLPKVCSNPGGTWTQVNAAISAGHSYTLTLTSHDDNYSSDPTYTEYDDVVVR